MSLFSFVPPLVLLFLSLGLWSQPALAPPPPSPYAFYSDVFGHGVTDPDASMSISQLIESRGFALEVSWTVFPFRTRNC